MRDLRRVHAYCPRRPSRRSRARARRLRFDQDRAGSRRRRSRRLSPLRGPAPRRHHRRGRRAHVRRAARAAEDARRTAGVVRLHPRHRPAGRAAGDGPFALPAPQLPSPFAERDRGRAGRSWSDGGRSTRGWRDGGRQPSVAHSKPAPKRSCRRAMRRKKS